MWDIRVTDVNDDLIVRMLERFSNDAQVVAVREGAPYDEGIAPHVHIYCVTKSSESWLRKQLQSLDVTRKGNKLYSMKKSHENSPNYVCKKIYEDTQQQLEILGHKRLIYKRNCDLDLVTTWKEQYNKYVEEIQAEKSRSRSMRSKSSNNFSKLIVKAMEEKYQGQGRPSPFELVTEILKMYNENDKRMPTRSMMEILVMTILMKLGQVHEVTNFYAKNLSP